MEEEDYQDYEETQENPEILEATPDLDNGNFKTEQTDSEAVPTADPGGEGGADEGETAPEATVPPGQ